METKSLGERISQLRSSSGLTQKELGDKLNVTAQAVSKWENGLSEPDIDTLKRLSVIFGISVSELVEEEAHAEVATAQATAAPVTEQITTRIINGYCETCKKPVGPGEYVVERYGRSGLQRIYCNECKKKADYNSKVSELNEHKKETTRSFIFGPIAGVVALTLCLILFLTSDNTLPVGIAIGISIVVGIAYFTFIVQIFWDGVVNDLFFDIFMKSFKMPGVIFTLDLEGILFLIFVKLGLALLSIFLSVVWFLLGVLFLIPIFSLVVYPFALMKHIHSGKKLKTEVANAKEQIL